MLIASGILLAFPTAAADLVGFGLVAVVVAMQLARPRTP